MDANITNEVTEILYKGESVDELKAIILLKEGADWKEFSHMTTLMLFAATNYQRDGWKSVTDTMRWGKRLSKLAVSKDFRAINIIPEQFRSACAYEFAQSELMQSRKTIKEWQATFMGLKEDLIRKILNTRPSLNKYVDEDRKELKSPLILPKEKKQPLRVTTKLPVQEFGLIGLDEVLDGNVKTAMTGEEFLALPYNEKTEQKLDEVIASSHTLPENFIKSLILPNRNAYFYQKKGDMVRCEKEKKAILPYMNKGKCMLISRSHPEAAIETPQFLDKPHIRSFWNKVKEQDPSKLAHYFLRFPTEMLDVDMLKDFELSADIINHAPEMFAEGEGHEMLEKYLDKHAASVLALPEQYQYLKFILKDGVILDARTIRRIKNKELRKKVQIALKIR